MKNEIVRCECVDMTVDGQGIARSGSLVVFVKGLIKGEKADVRIIAEKKNYSYGIIEHLIERSPYRVDPACPIAYKCGGCDYRHIAYDYQLVLKKEVLKNTFRDLPVEVEDIVPSKPDHYRNKVQVPVREGKMGFYRRNSNDIVEFDKCLMQFEEADAILKDLKELLDRKQMDLLRHIFLRKGEGSGEIMVGLITRKLDIPGIGRVVEELVKRHPGIVSVIANLNTRDDNVILGNEEKLLYGRSYIRDIYAGIEVEISLKSFYQVNHDQMIRLYSKAVSFLEEGEKVLDLYSGIGTISLFAASGASKVTGVEIVREAVENARRNAQINAVDNAEFYLDDATKNMERYLKEADVLIVDPPRKGISQDLINRLNASKIKKVIYISCNPATLARDLKLLEEKFCFDTVTPFDMFPQTVHVESVVLLKRKEA